MKRLLSIVLLVCNVAYAASASWGTNPILTAYDYSAGAICSLTWSGREFIDAKDHGRCLQSASSFDNQGEAFNPTEAGSYADGFMPGPSSSALTAYGIGADWAWTNDTMAYWNPVSGVARSNHVIRKFVQSSYNGMSGVVSYSVAYDVPAESHSIGQFEILTGYMPSSFSVFYAVSTNSGVFYPITDGPGEQPEPVVFCVPGGSYCMGVWNPSQPVLGGGYGRWRFPDCVKWNTVSRVGNPSGSYYFHVFIVVGTMYDVQQGLIALYLSEPHK